MICAYLRMVFDYLFRDKPIFHRYQCESIQKEKKVISDTVPGDKIPMNNAQPPRKLKNKVWMTKLVKRLFNAESRQRTKKNFCY